MEEEEYIGGVESSRLVRGKVLGGYGLYATNKRMIGVKKLGKAIMSGLLTDYGMLTSKKKSSQAIEEIERKKDLEVFKEDISKLEMRKPSFWHGGYLKIRTRTGEDILIKIGSGGKTFDKVKEVIEKFKPEALKLVSG